MKFFFDLFPIAAFFATFQYAQKHATQASLWATQWLGGLISGGSIGEKEAPIVLATIVTIIATLLQVLYLFLKKQKIGFTVWLSLILVVIFGGLTIYLHDETFIKIKPSILYWLLGGAQLMAYFLFKKNAIAALFGNQINLPKTILNKLNIAWAVFFIMLGFINWWVASNFETQTWVNFKMFGLLGLIIIFSVIQAFVLTKYVDADEVDKDNPRP